MHLNGKCGFSRFSVSYVSFKEFVFVSALYKDFRIHANLNATEHLLSFDSLTDTAAVCASQEPYDGRCGVGIHTESRVSHI